MRALARNTDPITSHIAADRVHEFSGAHKQQILAALRLFGPMTADEISTYINLSGHKILKRLSELHGDRLIAPTGQLKVAMSGRPQRVWGMV